MYADMDQDNKEAMCLAELGNLFRDRDVSVSLFHWRQVSSERVVVVHDHRSTDACPP